MAGFDLSSVLKDVSDLNTEEQLVKIELDKLDPDPENFYSLDGLDELAGNIETVGLQQPLRVRPGEGGHFIVVSGHRRRAACMLIRDGGSQQFKDGVPCIVEYGEASAALRKLRLIYANSSTRQLTSAEQSRQAEEVTRLLYELKEQGVEFPGRMRDHVAEACQLSKTKIARLHAIRANLVSPLLVYFDSGEMAEDVAYQLARFPEDIQLALSDKLADGRKRKMPTGDVVAAVYRNLDGLRKPMKCRAHAGGPECHHATDRVVASLLRPYSWGICDPGKCCRDCYHAKQGCSGACREAKERVKLEKACEEEKQEERKKAEEAAQLALKDRIRRRAKVLLPYAEKAGLGDEEKISSDYRSAKVSQLRKWADGDFGDSHFYGDNCVNPGWTKDVVSMAKKLGCSLELAANLPEKKEKAEPKETEPAWQTGRPTRAGRYLVRVKHKTISTMEQRMHFDPDLDELNCWRLFGAPLGAGAEILGWWPLPEEVTEE